MSNKHAAIDWQLCLELSNQKPDLAKKLLAMFAEELPQLRMEIITAYQNNRISDLEQYIHKLQGACCYCGATNLKKITEQLESQLKSANKNNVEKLMTELDVEIEEILLVLKDLTQ